MRTEHFPWNIDLASRFPQQREVFGFEGGCISIADADGKSYIIVDEGTMADFLLESDPTDAKVLAELVTVIEFDIVDERDATVTTMVAEHKMALQRMRQRPRRSETDAHS